MTPAMPRYPYGPFLACGRCGHGFAPPRSDSDVRRLQHESFGEAFAESSGAWRERYERANDRRAFAALARLGARRVLEVGPGSGSLMKRLEVAGVEVAGIDISPAVAEAIARRHGIAIALGELDAYAREHRGRFDCVVMRHVLEHFPDPRAALVCAAELLAPRGALYVVVPNAASWHRRFPGWTGYQPYHFHYFTPRSLRELVRGIGLEILASGTYEPLTGWPNTLYRSWRRPPAGDARTPARPILEALRLGIGTAIAPLRWLQAAAGRGEELVMTARRAAP